jgi:hypothetical protein
MIKDNKQAQEISRREFVKGSLATTVGVAVAATLPASVIAEQEITAVKPKQQKGYHLTDHILDYYKSAAQ